MHCRHCGGNMEGNGYSEGSYLRCERFIPHTDLCPEPDSGPWHCDTDGITDPEVYKTYEDCFACGRMVDPKELIDHTITPNGKEVNMRLCKDCNSHRNIDRMCVQLAEVFNKTKETK